MWRNWKTNTLQEMWDGITIQNTRWQVLKKLNIWINFQHDSVRSSASPASQWNWWKIIKTPSKASRNDPKATQQMKKHLRKSNTQDEQQEPVTSEPRPHPLSLLRTQRWKLHTEAAKNTGLPLTRAARQRTSLSGGAGCQQFSSCSSVHVWMNDIQLLAHS